MERILVVDDEVGIAGTVKAYFVQEGWTVDLAFTGLQALSLFDDSLRSGPGGQRPYSLAVLDLMLPDLSGEELCRRFRARSTIPVIMLTARVGPDAAAAGLDAGADDYLEKPFSPRELLARARAVLRRSVPSMLAAGVDIGGSSGSTAVTSGLSEILQVKNLVMDREARMVRKNGQRLDLTATEWRLLELFASRPGRIFTRAEIVDRALGNDYDGYDRTVDAHVKNLRKKIEDDPAHPRLIETVRGLGYRFGDQG